MPLYLIVILKGIQYNICATYTVHPLCVHDFPCVLAIQAAITTTCRGETWSQWWFCLQSGRISNWGSRLSTCCWLSSTDWWVGRSACSFIKVTSGCDLLIVCVIVISGGKPAASGAGGEGREWHGRSGAPRGWAVGSGHHRLQVNTEVRVSK